MRLVKPPEYKLEPEIVEQAKTDGVSISHWRLQIGDDWTLPAVELMPVGKSASTYICSKRLGQGVDDKRRGAIARRRKASHCLSIVGIW